MSGTLDGTTIGGTTPAPGTFTTLNATSGMQTGGTVDGNLVTANAATLARTLANRFADEYSLEDFGVVNDPSGTNVVANTAAYQAAINAACGYDPTTGESSGLARLRHRGGLTVTVSGLSVWSRSIIILDGVVNLAADTEAYAFDVFGSDIYIGGIGIIDGNKKNQSEDGSGGIGNSISEPSNIFIEGLTIRNFRNWAINIARADNVTCFRCNFLTSNNSTEFAENSKNCWFINCLCDEIADFGFAFYGGITDSGMIGCTARNGGSFGACVLTDGGGDTTLPCQRIIIANNEFGNNAGGSVIVLVGADTQSTIHTDIKIIGNIGYNNGTAGSPSTADYQVNHVRGIDILNNSSINMSNKTTSGPTYSFIFESMCSNLRASGNYVTGGGYTAGTHVGFIGQNNDVVFTHNFVDATNGFGAFAYDSVSGSNNTFIGNSFTGVFAGNPWAGMTPIADTILYANKGLNDYTPNALTASSLQIGPGGPTWTAGNGTPSGAAALGSLYSNTSGGAGSTLYCFVAGSWKPVA